MRVKQLNVHSPSSSVKRHTILHSTWNADLAGVLTFSWLHGMGKVPDLVWGELHITAAMNPLDANDYQAGDVIKYNNILELHQTDYILTFGGNTSHMFASTNSSPTYRRVAYKNGDAGNSGDRIVALGNCEFRLVGVWF